VASERDAREGPSESLNLVINKTPISKRDVSASYLGMSFLMSPRQNKSGLTFQNKQTDYKRRLFWFDVSLILTHLVEATLLGLLIGMSMQYVECSTIVYLLISLVCLMPMILTPDACKVKFKSVLSWVLIFAAVGFAVAKSLFLTSGQKW